MFFTKKSCNRGGGVENTPSDAINRQKYGDQHKSTK